MTEVIALVTGGRWAAEPSETKNDLAMVSCGSVNDDVLCLLVQSYSQMR